MRDRLHNIFLLGVTFLLMSCSVGGKLDQSLLELQNLNKNMEGMNANTRSIAASADKLAQSASHFDEKSDRMEEKFSQLSENMAAMVASVKEFEKLVALADDFKRLSETAGTMSSQMPKLMALADKINTLVDKFLDGKTDIEPDVSPKEFFKDR